MTKHHSKTDSALKLFDTKSHTEFMRSFMVPPGQKNSLAKDYDPGYKAH